MTNADAVRIRRLLPADAEALVDCFERCYGRTYANPLFYDAHALRALIEEGELRGVVAVQGARVVGHTGLTVRHPAARAIEAGNTVVDPDFRGGGLLGRLGGALGDLCRQLGYVGYVHYPTTAHTIMQTRSVAGGGVETGIMLAYIPADTEYNAIDRRAGRLAATVVYQPFSRALARDVFVPRRYPWLEELFASARLGRTAHAGSQTPTGRSQLVTRWNERRGLLHVDCVRAGADVDTEIEAARARRAPAIVHVDVGLDVACIDAVVDRLCGLGFFFCALLPEFGSGDVLRLQWLADPDAGLQADLANDGARRLLARMTAERNSDQVPSPAGA
jgi:GNAT superfamily N-acetyltransferase